MTSATAVAPDVTKTPPQTSGAFEVTFDPDPACVQRMRRITTAFVGLWNVSGPLAENIVLIVSELVTNAIEHGKGDVRLRVRYSDNDLRIEVTDNNPTPARLRPAGEDDDSGRGLLLVTVLARKWGTSDDGRTTWCVVRVPTRRS